MEEATSENVLLGVAMVRRSEYMYGKHLPRDAGGLVDNGLGKAVAYGSIGLLPPTLVVTQPIEEHVIDGVSRRVIVHRKGATPAGRGVLGIIPGSMAAPGYLVRGRGVDRRQYGARRRRAAVPGRRCACGCRRSR
jgi:hypothetical protein